MRLQLLIVLTGLLAVAPSSLVLVGQCPAAEAQRPNVILVMADDLGYETIGANGGTSYRTPNLDGLAANGLRMEHCYVQPLCTPTRVQLMTGAYNARNYVTFGQMDPGLTTFGNLFRSAGYVTGITGKWQLGRDPELPKKFGFDEHCLWQHTRRPPRYANPGLEINGVERDYSQGEYGPDLVSAFACEFVRRHKDQPFFLYYPMMLTHAPYQPTPDSKGWDPKASGESGGQRAEHFGDMVEYMDKLMGRLVSALDEAGIRRNTLLIFIGDNGTGRGTKSRMGDLTVIGGKGTTTAAGMHVPCIASWPAVMTSGRVSSGLVDSTDFLPTICEAAGIAIPADMTVDGRSFLSQMRGQTGQPRDWIYSWYSPRSEPLRECAFDQRFKLYADGTFYDLTTDRQEQNPLPLADLQGDSALAASQLRAVLAQFATARPDHLPRPAAAKESTGDPTRSTTANNKANKQPKKKANMVRSS